MFSKLGLDEEKKSNALSCTLKNQLIWLQKAEISKDK